MIPQGGSYSKALGLNSKVMVQMVFLRYSRKLCKYTMRRNGWISFRIQKEIRTLRYFAGSDDG